MTHYYSIDGVCFLLNDKIDGATSQIQLMTYLDWELVLLLVLAVVLLIFVACLFKMVKKFDPGIVVSKVVIFVLASPLGQGQIPRLT